MNKTSHKKHFITAALPYANGPLHFGHLSGVYLPADIYSRHCKLLHRDVAFICGSDEHGVAITLSAEKQKKSYQEYVDQFCEEHLHTFHAYNVEFDFYGRTSSKEHHAHAQEFFTQLNNNGALDFEKEELPYCEDCDKFLADRYLGGTCLNCGYEDARGDECPECGKWLSFEDLKDTFCQICKGTNIVLKTTDQYYLNLPKYEGELKAWLESHPEWKKYVHSYALSLIEAGLPKRAITRNLDWGIPVPGDTGNKKLYVWFEAPIGYLTFLKQFLEKENRSEEYADFLSKDADIIHFIGKDNIVFHTIVWPAILLASDLDTLPSNVPANLYLQLKNKQFSKSAGWYVDCLEAVEKFGPDKLRYYLCSIIPETSDSNFTWTGFEQKVNGELVNTHANFINRNLNLIKKKLENPLEENDFKTDLAQTAVDAVNATLQEVKSSLDTFEFRKALSAIQNLGITANKFSDDQKPWKLVKEDVTLARQVLAASLVYTLGLGVVFKPFLPNYASTIQSFFKAVDTNHLYENSLDLNALASTFSDLNFDVDLTIPRIAAEDIAELENQLA